MMVDGNDGTDQASSGSRRYVQLKAGKGGVTCTARIELNEEATSDYKENEDVETLFDSNLSDVPMVYTVAGGQAVSINQLPELDVVPFGVTCTGNEAIQCTMFNSDYAITNSPLYVFDALLGTTMAIGDGDTFSVQPNDYGRYFLTRGEKTLVDDTMADGIVVSVRKGTVVVTAKRPLSQVRILTAGGVMSNSRSDGGIQEQFSLQPGVYVVEAATAASKKTVKVVVR
jgi:hypothetical protein